MRVQRKLTIIIVMVLLTVVALGTSTYAWFTLNNIAKVDQIEMGITSGVGIEVSLDGKTWYNKLDSALISEKTNNVKLESITTINGYDMTALDGNTVANESKYVKFTLHFRVNNVNAVVGNDYGIYLTSHNNSSTYDVMGDGTAIKSKGVDWKPDVDYIDWNGAKVEYKTTDATKKYYVENSMRVSFKDNNNIKVFDFSQNSNADLKRGYAQTYGETDEEKKIAYGAYSYYKNKTNSDASNPTNAPVLNYTTMYNNNLTEILDESVTENNNSLISNLTKNGDYYFGETEIRIWIEGWDIDCFDAVLSDSIKLQMKFQFGIIHK